MKKALFLSLFATMMALFSTAQTAPLLIPGDIDTVNQVSTSAIFGQAHNLSVGGDWYSVLVYTKHDSVNWNLGTPSFHNSVDADAIDGATGLTSNTLYDVRHKAWYSGGTDTSTTAIQTVRTKQGIQQLSINFIDTLATLPNSGLLFSTSAAGHVNEFAFGLNSTTFQPETDTIWNVGGIDTVHFLNDAPGILHPRVRMIIRGDSGMVAFATITSPPFRTPTHTGGTLVLDSAYKGINSGEVVADITSIGNSGASVLITKVKNSGGVQVLPNITQTVSGPGLIHTQFAPLSSNSTYTISQELLNGFNQGDTITYTYLTSKVPAPALNALADTSEYEDLWRINIYVNTVGTYDSSGMKVIYIYQQGPGGTWLLIDSILTSITGTGSLSFEKLHQLAGTTYTLKVQGKNIAGLLSNAVILNVHTKIYNAPRTPTYDDLLTGSQNGTSAMQAKILKFYVNPGTSADFAFVPRDITDNHVLDTIYLAHDATQNLTFPSLDIVNLTGGHAYSGTVITIVAGGIVEGTTLLNVLPAPNSNAIAAGITKVTAPSPDTRIDLKGFGSGEGNPCTVSMHIDSAGVQDVRPMQLAPGTYSGDIELPFSFSNLTPGTEYKFRLDVTIVSNGNPATTYDYFRTDAATGITELEKVEEVKVKTTDPVADNQQVKILNVLAQVIAEGEYQTVRQQVRGLKTLFMQLLDKGGNAIPMVDEKGHTVYAKSVCFQ